jgi:cytochrome c553
MTIRVTWLRLLALAVAVGLAGLAFAWSGLFNVAASSGHWALTSWLLHYTMQQSVATHSAGIEAPPLQDEALVHRGGGHYASGCAPCHGAPGQVQSPIVLKMTPHPPSLIEKVPEWEDAELFWILRDGVKFSGMPSWPSGVRHDEIWSVVAFLRRLPEMSPEDYRLYALGETALPLGSAMAAGDAELAGLTEPAQEELENCARCHGRDGAGRRVGAFPPLTDFTEPYLYETLKAYANGRRHSGIMQPQAAGLEDTEMRALAAHYAAVTPREAPPTVTTDFERLRAGEAIARRGVPSSGVPACAACHGPDTPVRNELYPSLNGQRADYLAQHLRLWQQGTRGGTAYAHLMATIASRMTEEQIEAVADYYASLPAGREIATGHRRAG